MGKKEFAVAALDPEIKSFVVHIASLSFVASPSYSSLKLDIHSFHNPQISSLITNKASIKVLDKYVDFADIFSLDLASKLFEHTEINDHAIKLVNGQ